MKLFLASVVCSSQAALGEQEPKASESYSAVAVGTGGAVGGESFPFDFRITRSTTDEEVDQHAARNSVGNEAAVARKRKVGPDTVITTVTARIMPLFELQHAGTSVDYPFGFVRVTLNDDGEGTGQVIAAAKIRFDKKKGHYEIESYGNQYVKLVNVRPH